MTITANPLITCYATENTSNQSIAVNKIVIHETSTTRRTLQPTIVNNHKNPEATIEFIMTHERKGVHGFESENLPDLRLLKAGESLSFKFGSEETLALYNELSLLYNFPNTGSITRKRKQYLLIETTHSADLSEDNLGHLTELLERCKNSKGMAEKLAQLSPEIISNAHKLQILEQKRKGVQQFRAMLLENEASELEWQNFLKEQNWIFGGMHDIQYLSDVVSQPILSGSNVHDEGKKKGDFLTCTGGCARFTSVIEIKKANTLLLQKSIYVQDVYPPSPDLNGGVAQLRNYMRKWQIEGSRTEENKDILEKEHIYTVQPLGILIIGNTSEIKEDRNKRVAFDLFRQNQKDIIIITFDEVLHRAEKLLGIDS